MDALVTLLFDELRPALGADYALFGHSLGASVAYELARRIAAVPGLAPPRQLIVSGRAAPSVPERRFRHQLGRDAFRQMLRDLGGCPPGVLESDDLMEYFEPILRADFELVETHAPAPGAPLAVPILALIGDADDVTRADAEAWQQETTQPLEIVSFPGDHFFVLQRWPEIGALMSRRLALAAPAGMGA